jgi:hypothetical protein
MSLAGVYFEIGLPLTTGDSIEFTILFDEYATGRPQRMKCRGRVVRVEENPPLFSVASRFESYAFEEPELVASAK